MKIRHILIIAPALLLISAVVWVYIYPFEYHRRIIEAAHQYESQTISKAPYTLITERADSEGGAYATFVVKDSNDTVIYRCPDKYRTYDLKSIDWAEDGYNIVVDSGDVGETTYLFGSNTWFKNSI